MVGEKEPLTLVSCTRPQSSRSRQRSFGKGGLHERIGESFEGSETRKDIPVIAASLSGEKMLGLPEGLREEEIRRCWTKESDEDPDDGHTCDVLVCRDEQFRAVRGNPWGSGTTIE